MIYALLGAVMGLVGAPLGLFVARSLAVGDAISSVDVHPMPETYAYVALTACLTWAWIGRAWGTSFDREQERSNTDALTGLTNRGGFERRLQSMVRGPRGATCCVVLADVDGLKEINDRGGHKAGDVALLAVARGLSGNARNGDTVARVGGDEFAVLVPNASMGDATRLADRVLSEVALSIGALGGKVSISIGIAELRTLSKLAAEELITAADGALCAAKRAGGGRIVVSRN